MVQEGLGARGVKVCGLMVWGLELGVLVER